MTTAETRSRTGPSDDQLRFSIRQDRLRPRRKGGLRPGSRRVDAVSARLIDAGAGRVASPAENPSRRSQRSGAVAGRNAPHSVRRITDRGGSRSERSEAPPAERDEPGAPTTSATLMKGRDSHVGTRVTSPCATRSQPMRRGLRTGQEVEQPGALDSGVGVFVDGPSDDGGAMPAGAAPRTVRRGAVIVGPE